MIIECLGEIIADVLVVGMKIEHLDYRYVLSCGGGTKKIRKAAHYALGWMPCTATGCGGTSHSMWRWMLIRPMRELIHVLT